MNPTSKNTSVNKTKVPALFTTIKKHYGWKKFTYNLDMGGGKYDTATKFLKKEGVTNLILDEYNHSEDHNATVLYLLDMTRASTATLSNVLNVIKSDVVKRAVLYDTKAKLVKGGVVYINVYEGDKSGVGKITKKDCWQENKRLADYLPLVKRVFGNAVIEHGLIKANKK